MNDKTPTSGSSATVSPLSWRKKVLFSLVLALIMVVAIECMARAFYFVKEGANPFYLTFGFVNNTEAGAHSAQFDGYSKYEPGTTLHQKYAGRTIQMAANSDGFRGGRDFTVPKPATRTRIVVMGASSVFGFYVEDDQTFPAQLEQILRNRHPGKDIEVCNLGIPHATTRNILAMAKAELRRLQPDVLILYTGANDAGHPHEATEAPAAYQLKNWLFMHSMAWRSIHWSLKKVYYRFARATSIDPLSVPHLDVPLKMSLAQIQTMTDSIDARYRRNLEQVIALAEGMGAKVVLVTQASTAHFVPDEELGSRLRTYAEEVALIKDRLQKNAYLRAPLVALLNHARLMATVRELATKHGLMLVDGIAAIDTNRASMVSYVHLLPPGNKLVAEAIADSLDASL